MIKVDWIEGLNKSIEYIEENLTETIEMEKAGSAWRLLSVSVSKNISLYCRVTISEYTEEDV